MMVSKFGKRRIEQRHFFRTAENIGQVKTTIVTMVHSESSFVILVDKVTVILISKNAH